MISILSMFLLSFLTELQCESPENFLSSRVPIQDFRGLKEVFKRRNDNPLVPLLTPQVIKKYGYPVESHKVQTEDGYILTMHRIPFGKYENNFGRPPRHRPVVFLQHGLFASSFEWFMNTEDKLLALHLSDAGYDVWLGNARGNAYSREHQFLPVTNRSFWEFSVNEMGKFDIPAEIDHVLQTTKQKQLYYVGFSMGTTMFWTMMSHRPEYNSKVRLMIALAPVVYLNNMSGFPRFLAPFPGTDRIAKAILDFIGNGEFLPSWLLQIYNLLGRTFCSQTYIAEAICSNILFLFAGYDLPQSQVNQLPVFFTHTPSPTSTRVLAHLAQFINSGHFREYDFGRLENLRRYGKTTPPDYNLSNTKVPVALIYGPNDAVVNPIDARRLNSLLPNVVLSMPVNFTFWNHFDYHLAKDSNELVNRHVLKLLAKY